jgi:hypothetical protein
MDLQPRSLSCPLGPCPQGYTELVGHEEVNINSGEEVEISVGNDKFKTEVPQGKSWKVNLSLCIVEH